MKRISFLVAFSCLLLGACKGPSEGLDAQDLDAFRTPLQEYWPETWFHFIGDNVSREGIDADLEAIRAAGIGGVHWFHGAFGGRWPGVENPVVPLSAQWDGMVAYMGRKAHEEGLRLTLQACPGWAMAGGPWIEPADAMRDLVWSRTDVPGGSEVVLRLPKGEPSGEQWHDYQDICVLAFPTPEGDGGKALELTDVRSDEADWAALLKGMRPGVRAAEGTTHRVRFRVADGSIIRTLRLPSINSMNHAFNYTPGMHIALDAFTSDGRQRVVDCDLPMASWQDNQPMDLAVNEELAQEYELTVRNEHPLSLAYVRFLSAARKNDWQAEAGRTLRSREFSQEHTRQDERSFVHSADVLDLSGNMDAEGRLVWMAPEGAWTLLRLGHVNSGRRNGPAPAEATGWECNKLDSRGAEKQFAGYVGRLQDGPLEGLASGMLMDSWECYNQTWTQEMEAEFGLQNGYDLRPLMPALTGYVMDSQEKTACFLLDWRRTLTQLYNRNFFQRMTDLAHEKGLKVQYETAAGDVVAADILEYFKYADTPMCEFWHPLSEGYVGDLNFKPVKPTASAAHLYGKPRVDAESFTSFDLNWDEHWEMLKEVANLNMTEGVTHNVFHTYTHNPQVNYLPPGTSFGSGIGTPFLRGQTWWKYMKEFTTYLARTSYMLERGRPVVDVLWYLGDEVSHKPDQRAAFPAGYKYDYCNPDALLTRLRVKDGVLCTPDGQRYGVLWIPENQRMLPETVEKLYELVKAGARLVAGPPRAVATLRGGEEAAGRLSEWSQMLWTRKGEIAPLGKGFVAWDVPLEEALKAFGCRPQLLPEGGEVLWTAREAGADKWFYVTAPVGGGFHGSVSLLGKGTPRLWDAVSGKVYAPEARSEGDYTRVKLDLEHAQNCFIVFSESLLSAGCEPLARSHGAQHELEGWMLSFPEGWGAPVEAIALDGLQPWKELPISDEGKAFSGTAAYATEFKVPEGVQEVLLDLGRVDMIAEVMVNGNPAGVLWATPYRLTIPVHEGVNTLSVAVTSTWYNRLVYDAALPEQQRKTWTIAGPRAGSPLRPSGLLGPVRICY